GSRRDLPAFPTRRSSDLDRRPTARPTCRTNRGWSGYRWTKATLSADPVPAGGWGRRRLRIAEAGAVERVARPLRPAIRHHPGSCGPEESPDPSGSTEIAV